MFRTFESFIAREIVKAQLNAGRRRELYYLRDQQRLEVDFIVPTQGGGVRLVEAKAARTVTPSDAAPLRRLAAAWRGLRELRGSVEMTLVHPPARTEPASHAVAPGVRTMPWQEFVKALL
jgi:predicted AAA+ superfamily ATPase